jgi:EAL domain-containing protein (putative c-di-GMP-specific phosphodiesterase class I)
VLVRLREEGELILPGAFVEAAERVGVIADLDRWVIRNTLAYLADSPGHVAHINLSARSATSRQTPAFVAAELARTGVDPAAVVFEVTETAAIADLQRARVFITQITDLGCSIALDDFGAGFGSFYYLKYFPMSLLKINGEFIRNLSASSQDRAIVQAIVAMAHSLGKQTVAEHVQDGATLTLLCELGVDYAQGFHIARPAPITDRQPSAAD